MKIIKPSFEILNIPDSTDHDGVLRFIESIGRVCYKSENNITEDSHKKFIQMIRDSHHWAILEHYIFTFAVSSKLFADIREEIKYSACLDGMQFIKYSMGIVNNTVRYAVSLSATTANTVLANLHINDALMPVINELYNNFPELIVMNPTLFKFQNEYTGSPESIHLMTREEIKAMNPINRINHDFMTVKFTVDRGVSHELVRHRPCSFAQESTRYCNYSKGKFGSEITVIEPSYFYTDAEKMLIWRNAMKASEELYFDLLNAGATPQEARAVLPNSLKTELMVTARLSEWLHIFKMRADKAAHPQMREIMYPLLKKCIDTNPEIYERMLYKLKEDQL